MMTATRCPHCEAETPGLHCQNCGLAKSAPLQQRPPAAREQPDQAVLLRPAEPAPRLNDYDLSVPINQVPHALRDTRSGTNTAAGLYRTVDPDEVMITTVVPSPLYVGPMAVRWGLGILFTIFLAIWLGGGWPWVLFWMCVAAAHLGLSVLALSKMKYRLSTQRIEIHDGLLHMQTRAYETHHLSQEATIDRPFPLGFLGLANLTVAHLYGNTPPYPAVRIGHKIAPNGTPTHITLVGMTYEEAENLRERLRTTGQIEAERTDKVRWR